MLGRRKLGRLGLAIAVAAANPYAAYAATYPSGSNLETHFADVGSRTKYNGLGATLNTHVAPDGAMAADTLTAGSSVASDSIAEEIFPTTAAAHTSYLSVHKTAGTAASITFQMNKAGGGSCIAGLDKTTGVLTQIGATGYEASRVVDLGTYWLVLLLFTPGAGNTSKYVGPSDASNDRAVTAGKSIVVWGSQTLLGNFVGA